MEAEEGDGETSTVRSPLKVLYMHGGGANPATSYKAQYLMKHFDCSCPHMVNTSFYDDCRRLQSTTLRDFQPDVCVGSSLGAALLLELLRVGMWRGPAVMMCPAVMLSIDDISLPSGVPIIVAHGTQDRVVSVDVSRQIVETNKNANVELIEVDGDGHNMESVTQTDMLKEWIEEVFRRRDQISGYDHERRLDLAAIDQALQKTNNNQQQQLRKKKCSLQ